ncbi:snRNA-activating protein complex subunit 4 [Fopius arisanus]|uniref:Snapc4 protein n=1 Tax=Fopius arisanus TaxID=64838 RepID=A0A0C9RB02_9HYME|nr:PREDICTED: snRNA-activating protein complex subunit 4 [Fopius arisanus]
MSDFDDDFETLEDIKLLENALAQDPRPEPRLIRQSSPIDSGSRHTIADTLPTSTPQELLINQAFYLNESLICSYKRLKEQIVIRLQEIARQRKEITSKLNLFSKGTKRPPRLKYRQVGFPYFKDRQEFPSPFNDDAITKATRRELMVVYQRMPRRWTMKDRNTLWTAVGRQTAIAHFEKVTTRRRHSRKNSKQLIKSSKNHSQVFVDVGHCHLPKNYKEIIGPRGSREFDWMKIAAQYFHGRHSADECRVMWNVYLHPDVNRYKFPGEENLRLMKAVEERGHQDWDGVAEELETRRTGYQCFIRYTTLRGPLRLKNKDVWTAREDQVLVDVVQALKIGNYIPWSCVTFYIDNRNKNQVYSHWKYCTNPCLRKGRFTADEDELILEGVTKYGRDFSRISTELLPHRTSVQLSGRFTLLMLKTDKSYNTWTVGEDMQLLKLYDDLGPRWCKIAGTMKRNRTYVRHRYMTIVRYMTRGIDLSNVPRKRHPGQGGEKPVENDLTFCERILLENMEENNVDVDTRLRRYFKSNQTCIAPPGRVPKYSAIELERYTKGLNDIFKKLDVHLNVPEHVDTEGLTLRDKQLLVAFQEYSRGTNRRKKDPEVVRREMFRNEEVDKFYIPPAPFGLSFKIPSKKRKGDLGRITDNCNIVLDFYMETPENIEKMLKEEELKSFKKLEALLSSPCLSTSHRHFEKKFLAETSEDNDIIASTEITAIFQERKVGEKLNAEWRERESVLEPCYSTLLGLEKLRVMKEHNGSLQWPRDDRIISKEPVSASGKRAFRTFKTRFTRLFKYPIGMIKYSETKAFDTNLVVIEKNHQGYNN